MLPPRSRREILKRDSSKNFDVLFKERNILESPEVQKPPNSFLSGFLPRSINESREDLEDSHF